MVLLLFFVLLCLIAYLDTRKPKNFPPGPRWYPIVGCMWELNRICKRVGSLTAAVQVLAEKYGNVIGVRLGCDRIIFVHGFDEIREFTTKDDFKGRPSGLFTIGRTRGKKIGLLFTDSQLWKEQRRFVMAELRRFGFNQLRMMKTIGDEMCAMVSAIKKKMAHDGCVLRMDDFFGPYVISTLWVSLTGTKCSAEHDEIKSLQALVTDLFIEVHMGGALFSHFPILKYICPRYSGYTKYVEIHDKIFTLFEQQIEEIKKSYNCNCIRGLVDAYLKTLDSPAKSEGFSIEQLTAICLDLFIADSSTTSKTFGFAFLYLVLYPDVQKKAQEEIDRVIGRKRLPNIDDRAHLQYTEGIVLESLRMFGGRAFTIAHKALNDSHLRGYSIPKNTHLIGQLQSVLLEENSGWKDPEVFNPERYIRNGQIEIPKCYIPFSMGKHKCLGENLAQTNLFLVIACMLQNFNFAALPDEPPPSGYLVGLTPGPHPFNALVTLR